MAKTTNALESKKIVRPSELKIIVKHCLLNNFPILVRGKLGSGKTQICREAAIEAGFKPNNIIIEAPHMKDVPDYTGFAFVFDDLEAKKKRADFLPINTLEKMLNATEPTVFIIDELDKAKLTMNAIAQIIWQREISNRKIPDCVRFIATCNLAEEQTGSSVIKPHLLDRFYSVVELKQNVEDWVHYMLKNWGANALVLTSFINFRPQYLLEGQNTELALSLEKTPTGRSLENYLKMYLTIALSSDPEEQKALERLLAGAVGDEFHIEFKAFCELYKSDLPNFEEITSDPHNAMIPTGDRQINMRHAIIGMISGRVNEKTCNSVTEYLLRKEWNSFATLRRVFVEQVKILHPELLKNPTFIRNVVDLINAS